MFYELLKKLDKLYEEAKVAYDGSIATSKNGLEISVDSKVKNCHLVAYKIGSLSEGVTIVTCKDDPMNSTFNTNQVYSIFKFTPCSSDPWKVEVILEDGHEFEMAQKLL